MAGRYPDHDWRGIAMLTQQLGQLFEPSKAKMMSQQHEHEMNMLMAKKSWDMQSEQLTLLKKEYDGLVTDLDTETEAVERLGLNELVRAGMKDGANTDQASEVYEKLDIKKLSDMQVMADKYREMIRDKKTNLSNMELYNTTAIVGQEWRKGSMHKKDRKGVMNDYYKAANLDGIADLSYEEGQNMIKSYIKDNYLVAEGEEGMQMTFGSGDQTESFMVKPEAIAFRAGWQSGTGTGTGRGKAETAEIRAGVQSYEIDWKELSPQKITDIYTDQVNTVNRLNDKYKKQNKPSIGQYLHVVGNDWVAKDITALTAYDAEDIDAYIGARNTQKTVLPHLARRKISPDIDISKQGYVITDEMRDFFKDAIPGMPIDPNNLYKQIESKSEDDKYELMVNSYEELLRDYNKTDASRRKQVLNILSNWTAE